jgi:hypothetical protein
MLDVVQSIEVGATSDDPIGRLVYFVCERERVRIAKESGQPRPWTQDRVLQTGRFCNIRREDDPVTKWIAAWLAAHADDPDLFIAAMVARLINEPATLATLSWPVPFDAAAEARFIAEMDALQARQARGELRRIYNPAYVIPAGPKGMPTHEHLARNVLHWAWEHRDWLRPRAADSLLACFARMTKCPGIGDFICGQIVTDLKFLPPLRAAPDWMTWCIWGPGSMKGVNYMMGRDPKAKWKRLSEWRAAFDGIWARATPLLLARGIPELSATDRQNCMCEDSKWERARRGGRVKQGYQGAN